MGMETLLNGQRAILASLIAELEAAQGELPSAEAGAWWDAARAYYALSLVKLRGDVAMALDAMRSAYASTDVAWRTVAADG